jgi:tRNA (guanine-N7-)-methyltransferase
LGEAGSGRRAPAQFLTAPEPEPQQARVLFGRRRGRALRSGQKTLITGLLPQLTVKISAPGRLDPCALFGAVRRPTWLEIGFGGGEHLAWQASRHPETGFIGCEVFENGIVKLLAQIERQRLDNIRIFADDARLLLAALAPASIDRVFILFPDPWPKRRHHKRRFIARETLDRLAEIMTDDAELRVATDYDDYLSWILERLTHHSAFEWLARRPDDWRKRPADWPPTRYEEKAGAAGRVPVFLRFRQRRRSTSDN